ncbi:MAG: hypothetical protein KA105_02605 [Caulobacter sp.]|nr:hypothetical protein [Caulobacter sp.]
MDRGRCIARFVVTVAASASCLATIAVAAEPLSASDVNSFVGEAKVKPSDPFKKPLDQRSIIGRSLRVEIPVTQEGDRDNSSGNAVYWSYNASREELTLKAWPRVFSGAWDENAAKIIDYREVAGFLTNYSLTKGNGGARSNAFGATANVQTQLETSVGIATIYTHNIGPTIFSEGPNDAIFYSVTLSIPPEQAKALVSSARLVVEGQVVEISPFQSVICESEYFAPTIRNPREYAAERCFVSAKLSRMAFVDKASSRILREWKSR